MLEALIAVSVFSLMIIAALSVAACQTLKELNESYKLLEDKSTEYDELETRYELLVIRVKGLLEDVTS